MSERHARTQAALPVYDHQRKQPKLWVCSGVAGVAVDNQPVNANGLCANETINLKTLKRPLMCRGIAFGALFREL